MPLLEIPPFVLADEDPPTATTELRSFHCRSYQVIAPVAFPREPFTDALAEHARLLDAHGAEILAAPLDHPGQPLDDRFVAFDDLHLCGTVLISDGAAHEVHKWRTVDLSYVVYRCRGIVLQLMETPPAGCSYVVVVARGAASLHLVRGVAPSRVGDAARLEVTERDLVVEPWEQWHLRQGRFLATWWRTPLGELVASRVRVLPWPADARAAAVALLRIRGHSVRRRLDARLREHPKRKPLAIVDTSIGGEEIELVDRPAGHPLVVPFPAIATALQVTRPGLDPVLVFAYHWGALFWLPASASSDLAVPEPLVVKRTPQPSDRDDEDEDEEEDAAAAKPEPRLRLNRHERFLAMWDDFPPIDPWAPRPTEIHFVWMFGLMLAFFVGAFLFGLRAVAFDWEWDPPLGRVLDALFLVLAVGGGAYAAAVLRWRLRDLQPARRKRRWQAWKQVKDDLQRELRPPKPKPRVYGRKFWMRRLAERLARLERLAGLDAPEVIIDHERRLVRDAVAELDKSDADAVLAAWPGAVRHLEPKDARAAAKKRGAGTDKPN